MRCMSIINHSIKDHPIYGDEPIFCVTNLDDRAFAAGFRVLNPEYKALPDRVTADTEDLRNLLQELDEQDELAPKVKRDFASLKDRFLRKNQDHDWRGR